MNTRLHPLFTTLTLALATALAGCDPTGASTPEDPAALDLVDTAGSDEDPDDDDSDTDADELADGSDGGDSDGDDSDGDEPDSKDGDAFGVPDGPVDPGDPIDLVGACIGAQQQLYGYCDDDNDLWLPCDETFTDQCTAVGGVVTAVAPS